MTKTDQARIITELCDSIKKEMLESLPRIPEEWDGIELRQWFSELAAFGTRYKMDRSRKRKYNNTIIINNL